jgi:hypothetical protein
MISEEKETKAKVVITLLNGKKGGGGCKFPSPLSPMGSLSLLMAALALIVQ